MLFDIPVAYRVAESASLSAGLITWLLLDPTKAPTAVLSPAPRAPRPAPRAPRPAELVGNLCRLLATECTTNTQGISWL